MLRTESISSSYNTTGGSKVKVRSRVEFEGPYHDTVPVTSANNESCTAAWPKWKGRSDSIWSGRRLHIAGRICKLIDKDNLSHRSRIGYLSMSQQSGGRQGTRRRPALREPFSAEWPLGKPNSPQLGAPPIWKREGEINQIDGHKLLPYDNQQI